MGLGFRVWSSGFGAECSVLRVLSLGQEFFRYYRHSTKRGHT